MKMRQPKIPLVTHLFSRKFQDTLYDHISLFPLCSALTLTKREKATKAQSAGR